MYEKFYGKSIVNYVAPLITMGKAHDVATALAELGNGLYCMCCLLCVRFDAQIIIALWFN